MAISDYVPFFPAAPARFVNERGNPVHAIMAEYDSAADVYHAAEQVRDAGHQKWDLHSPFPIHGVEHAMGFKRTILPLMVAGGGFSGVLIGLLLQYFVTWYEYPLVVQGRPHGAWEPFVMVMFELGVLFSAFTALFGMMMLNGLPRHNHPLLNTRRFLKVSDDRFFIVINADDPAFDPARTRTLLQKTGGRNIELVEDLA